MTYSAAAARSRTDAVVTAAARAPIEQVYAQIQATADQGLGTTIIVFAPFTFPPGGSTDPAAAPFLNELVQQGYTLTAAVDEAGNTNLQVSW